MLFVGFMLVLSTLLQQLLESCNSSPPSFLLIDNPLILCGLETSRGEANNQIGILGKRAIIGPNQWTPVCALFDKIALIAYVIVLFIYHS